MVLFANCFQFYLQGTQAVEGKLLHQSQSTDLHFANKFKTLMRIRILNVDSPWIEWFLKMHFLQDDEYLPKSLPSKFCPEILVKIFMPNSNVEKLWDGVQVLQIYIHIFSFFLIDI